MKYKKKVKWLKDKQAWWDKQGKDFQAATTRPGSVKTRQSMLAIILAIVLIIAFIYYDPYVDITEDNVLLWYNGKGYREYIILWSRNTN